MHGHIFNAEKYMQNSTDVSTRDFWHKVPIAFTWSYFSCLHQKMFQLFLSPSALSSSIMNISQVFPEKFCIAAELLGD